MRSLSDEFPLVEGFRRVAPKGNPAAAHILLLSATPSEEEAQGMEAFSGDVGDLLTVALERAGIPVRCCYLTHAIPFLLKRHPSFEELMTMRPLLVRLIDAINPEGVVALGKEALAVLLGKPIQSWEDAQGGKQKVKGFNAPVYGTLHPRYVLKSGGIDRSNGQQLIEDLRRVSHDTTPF